jgi:hypothetical protein
MNSRQPIEFRRAFENAEQVRGGRASLWQRHVDFRGWRIGALGGRSTTWCAHFDGRVACGFGLSKPNGEPWARARINHAS